jgi:hypothetical protein
MAIDPNIALGVRGIEIANPLAQYGQVSQIQNYQNQNALAQYQLATAQREQESVNALNQAYAKAYNPQTGEIDINTLRQTLSTGGFGSKLPGLEKTFGELEKQKLEAHVELCAERYSQLNEKLDNLDRRLTTVEEHLLAIRDSITNKTGGINKQLITIGTTVLGVLATAVIGLLIHLVNK